METPTQVAATQESKTDPRKSGLVDEVKSVVKAVEEKVEEVVGNVVHTAEKSVVTITAEEKLVIRELENKFLKTQMEITRLQNVAQEVQKNFPAAIEQLKKKYVIDPANFIFDVATLEFRRK